jgi:hypothetical protein
MGSSPFWSSLVTRVKRTFFGHVEIALFNSEGSNTSALPGLDKTHFV